MSDSPTKSQSLPRRPIFLRQPATESTGATQSSQQLAAKSATAALRTAIPAPSPSAAEGAGIAVRSAAVADLAASCCEDPVLSVAG